MQFDHTQFMQIEQEEAMLKNMGVELSLDELVVGDIASRHL